ncbi:META domain-containing protein [Patescibacteria group bacterium]|nr:META domain-containing protein [Patescibacteria group bacterium]
MKHILIWVIVLGVLVSAGVYGFSYYQRTSSTADTGNGLFADYKNGTYTVGGTEVEFVDGKSEVAIVPGSAAQVVTQYFGNEVRGDVNGDGNEDISFLITQNSGGSGAFFYLVSALKEDGGYRSTNAVFIGDRIAPQTTEFKNGVIVVNYADRKPGEPMTNEPTEGKSLYLKYDATSNSFGEVVQNFEGEADPKKMSLTMKPWEWISSQYENGKQTLPNTPSAFVLTFNTDGTFSLKTDCNQMGGSYSVEGEKLTFSKIFSTKMYCEGSQETEFSQMLQNVAGYSFTSKGELILALKFDSGTSVFR